MEYFAPIRKLFELNADPVKAAGAKAYMKDISEFYGLTAPTRRQVLQEFLKSQGLPQREDLGRLIEYAWNQPQREWQYIAMEITGRLARKGYPNLLVLSEFMITHKSWWDTVDYISPNIAGTVLSKNPGMIQDVTGEWMKSGNKWLQRACLLFQLKYKEKTDSELLFRLCDELSGHPDFFIRKAIGWSLREYSKSNPVAVSEFVKMHTLSPLSRKEATRLIEG